MDRTPWHVVARWLLVLPLLVGALPGPAARGAPQAQAEPTEPITLVASGLSNPRGLTWDAQGVLYVAQAGTGDAATSTGAAAGVVRIDAGCPQAVGTGFASTRGMSGAVQGPSAVAFLDGTLYVLQDGENVGDLIDTFPNGVYAVDADGGPRLVADLSRWLMENRTHEIPEDYTKIGETFAMLAGDGFLWVLESNEGQVLKVTPDGTISRVADLSEGHPVPTGFALSSSGGVYVGFLTPAPYPDGSSRVVEVAADGSVTEVWTGLTMVTGLATGADGTLYAIEMSTLNTTERPFITPGSGRLVKQVGKNQSQTVLSGLDYPIALAVGPDGGFYVSSPALGVAGPAGVVLRIDPTAQFLDVPDDLYAAGTCAGFAAARAALTGQGTAAAQAQIEGVNQPVPSPAAPTAVAAAPGAAAEAPSTAAVAVEIVDFSFRPPTLEIATGTTVTWTNRDTVPHTATSTATLQTFNSGNLNPGQSFGYTFNTPGTNAYICTYHPWMKGTITVTGEAVAGGATPAAAPTQLPAPAAPTVQPATPVASDGITVVASGLHAPRGIAWGADGALYVVQSGTGETATSTGAAAAVVRVDGGCPVQVATGLPSTFDPYQDVMGPQDIAELDGKLYVVVATTGPLAEMDPQTPNGIYEVQADGTFRLVADLTKWILANPTVFTPGDANDRGEPYRLLPGDGFLWVLESNRGEVLKVTLDGGVSRVADLSVGHPVPAGFALAPDGGVYVGILTHAPSTDGTAKVMKVTADGQVSDVWVNLTTVTGVAVGPDGTLYAIEMATDISATGNQPPGSGRLVMQTGADQSALVAIDLDYPISLEIGPDGAAYVAFPAYGASDQAGMVARIDLSAPRPMALDDAQLTAGRCPGAAAYVVPAPGIATPVPVPTEAPAASTAATAVASTGTEVRVDIKDFAFAPSTLTIAAGTTVTWTNNDTVPHTATSSATPQAFNSDNLNPGQSFTSTFDTPGTNAYTCIYHPFMKGTITVT